MEKAYTITRVAKKDILHMLLGKNKEEPLMKKMLMALLCLALIVPATVMGEGEATFGLTHGAQTPLYAQATTTSEATKVYPEGTWAQITATAEGDFYPVTTQDGTQGYIETNALTLESEAPRWAMLIKDEDGVVNMRVEPSMGARVRRFQKAGKMVTVLEAGESFSLCDYNGIAEGYIINTRLAKPTAEVTAQRGARIRKGPGMAYDQVRIVPCGAEVTLLVKGDRWCKVCYGDYEGYVSSDSLAL